MKKTILLLFSVGALSTVFAQDGWHSNDKINAREVILAQNNQRNVYDSRDNNYNNDIRRKAEEIARVNKDYDRKIDAVKRDRHLKSKEKSREIARLQREKEQAIRDINARYDRQAPHRNYGKY